MSSCPKLVIWGLLMMLPLWINSQNKAPLALSGAETQVALVVDLSNGDTLYRYHEGQRITPASLTKLFTTVAALDVLGSQYQYQTLVFIDADNQRLVVRGGGDPTLGSSFFEAHSSERLIGLIVDCLASRRITALPKGVVIDLSYFGNVRPPSQRLWEDLGNYFGALPSSLTVGDNTFRLFLDSPVNVGELCTISRMTPQWGAFPQSLVVASRGQSDSAYIYGVAGCDRWYVSGSIPAGRTGFMIKGAMPEPHRCFGELLLAALNKSGIAVEHVSYSFEPVSVSGQPIVSFSSPSLKQICNVVNKQSNNLYADHLFLSLGKVTGQPGWDGGVQMMNRYCRKHLSQRPLSIYDGSGLSPFNSFSAADMVTLLRHAVQRPFFDDFYQSLAVSGVDGTIRNLWRDHSSFGRIRAKSGTMNGVLGYAGYITTDDHRMLAFCIVVNHAADGNSKVRLAIEQWVRGFLNPR